MSDKAREQLEAEAGSILLQRAVHVTSVNVVAPLLADWAESLQREAVAEERKALREMLIEFSKESPPAGHDRRRYVCNEILAALDARSKP